MVECFVPRHLIVYYWNEESCSLELDVKELYDLEIAYNILNVD